MLADLKFISFWWLTIFLFSLLALPLIFTLFKNFWDRGYIFAKIVSLALLTYLIFVLGVLKILPFTHASLYFLVVLAILANIFFLKKNHNLKNFKEIFKKYFKIFLFEELIFLLILITWSFIRGFAPDIEGLEKFMDWGFVNSALRTRFMPPEDMWFAGKPINYYYFGHLIFALLTKASNISSAITYNLSMATVCALTFVSSFSVTSNLIHLSSAKLKFKSLFVGGILSALLLTFGGNLHWLYKVAKINIQNEGRLTLTATAIKKAADSYWYPDATRFIGFDPDIKDKTIHEFPIYSFVVSDLHGHMNDIPLVLFFVAFLLASITSVSFSKKYLLPWFFVPAGLILSVNFMTNAWDLAVYGLLFGVVFLFANLNFFDFKTAFTKTVFNGLLMILFWYLFTLPFSLNFIPMIEGLRLSDSHTPFYQLFILYGGFWLICFPFLFVFIKKVLTNRLSVTDSLVLSLILTATILILIPEIIYIKDIYIFEHRRANTMFKLVYQAFMLYSLAAGYVLFRISQTKLIIPKIFYKLIFLLVFVIHLTYPYFAVKSFYGLKEYKGLWGLNFLKNSYPDNLAAIEWIQQNISGQPVMLEAVGDSYTIFNQVSSATGLPTIEGWIVHEWLWRGGYDQPSARQAEVQKIYESENSSEVQSLLQKYSVKYIFVGDKEYEKYPKLNEKNFTDLGAKIIFTSGKTKIYQL